MPQTYEVPRPGYAARLQAILSDENYGPKLARLSRADEQEALHLINEGNLARARRRISELDRDRLNKIAEQPANIARRFPAEDRPWVIKIINKGWWDNGESLDNFRRSTGTAQSAYYYADDLVDSGVPSNVVNIRPVNGDFAVYAGRTS